MFFLLLSIIGLSIFIFWAYGIKLSTLLKLKNQTYSAPIGLAAFISVNQLFYYPVQYFNLSFNYIIVITSLIYGYGIYLCVKYYKEITKEIFSKNTIYLIISTIVFLGVFYNLFIDIEFSDSQMYLNYIAQNINIDELNMFNLYTGEVGYEWEAIYLFQGYYHFGSYLCWLVNIPYYVFGSSTYLANITISTWGLGIIYSVISSMFFISMINYLDIKNKLLNNSLLIFTLLYSNFYYWRVALSFYGNTYRTLLITMLMFFIYVWIKEKKDSYKYLIIILLFAGIAFSSSFLFIAFAVMLCLTFYLFINKEKNAFITMSVLVSPMLVYAIALFSKENIYIGLAILGLSVFYYLGVYFKFLLKYISIFEEFVFKHAKLIFYIILPIILALYSLYVNIFNETFLYGYEYWFKDHQTVDMVQDYRFIYSSPLTFILNIFRWYGIYLIIKQKDNNFIKVSMVTALLVFLNPLTTTAIADTIASNVFYRIVEVLFNPFTEAVIFIYIFNRFNQKKVVANMLSILMIVIMLANHFFSFTGSEIGHYTFYVDGGKTAVPLYKISWPEYDIIQKYIEVSSDDNDDDLVVLSHTDALRSFSPETMQIFTARDHFYFYSRIDENFYRIARDRYPWEEYPPAPYEDTCMYIQRYDTDYLIIGHIQNEEYNKASDACSITIYENDEYVLKQVTYDVNFEK